MTARLTPQREAVIVEHLATCTNWSAGNLAARDLAAELAAVRAERDAALGSLSELREEVAGLQTNFMIYRRGAAHTNETLRDELDELRAGRDEAQGQLAEYEPLNPQQCPFGKHTDWLVDSEHTHTCPWCQIDQLREELATKRDEIAADIHRAELPVFAETENPALVAKTVRAIDVRLADRGSEAPYWVAKAGDRS